MFRKYCSSTAIAMLVLAPLSAYANPMDLLFPKKTPEAAKNAPSSSEKKPPQPVAPASQKGPEPWKGTWKLLAGGKQISVSLVDKSIGPVGGRIEGQIGDGSCPIMGTWFSVVQAQFPDGITIRQMPLYNIMSFVATCQDKSKLVADMLFLPKKDGHVDSAGGRLIFVDESGKGTEEYSATLMR